MAQETPVKIETLRSRDVFRWNGKKVIVKTVEPLPVGCPWHVHINGDSCYDAGTLVYLDN